jgi:hypothetical protein
MPPQDWVGRQQAMDAETAAGWDRWARAIVNRQLGPFAEEIGKATKAEREAMQAEVKTAIAALRGEFERRLEAMQIECRQMVEKALADSGKDIARQLELHITKMALVQAGSDRDLAFAAAGRAFVGGGDSLMDDETEFLHDAVRQLARVIAVHELGTPEEVIAEVGRLLQLIAQRGTTRSRANAALGRAVERV